jgi:hypothetical protein
VVEDTIVEAHLTLADWARFLEKESSRATGSRTRPPESMDRRVHERLEMRATARVLRYSLRPNSEALSVDTSSLERPARNVSLGGIFITAARHELASVGAGCVVHVSVTPPGGKAFQLRAVVVRREESGLALRWIADAPVDQRVVESLLETVNRTRAGS